MELKDLVRKYALQNAIKFEGKPNMGAVIGKVIAENPDLKTKAQEIAKEAKEILKEVSKLSVEKATKELEKIAPELLKEPEHKEKEHLLPELKNAKKGKVVMRFAPSPSGPMHVGHAYISSLNSEYCRKYNGQLILRIEDTNSDNIYEQAYGMLPEEANWITRGNVHKVIVQSERMGLYYDYADKLIDMGKGYVCTCDPDHYKQLIQKMKACPCRELPVAEQHKRFEKMFAEYKPGEAVLRCKTDLNDPNPAMRDFPLMRINDSVHPRQGTKFKVWPLMNFSVFVDDTETGVTHTLRAKEHMDNEKRQRILCGYFGKPSPEAIFVGRINFTDLRISCSKTRALINEGKYKDWSDIRLPFLAALKRRGYQPDAFIKYALDVGVSQRDKVVSGDEFFQSINHFNKQVLDPISDRIFFIANPKEITVKGAKAKHVEIDVHPDYPKKGKRKFDTTDTFYVAEEDLNLVKAGELIRLMDCMNIVKKGKEFVFDSEDVEKYREAKKKRMMHWLPKQDGLINVELMMPDGSVKAGLAEPRVKQIKAGESCQFERVGFVRLDEKKEDKLVFWFTHR